MKVILLNHTFVAVVGCIQVCLELARTAVRVGGNGSLQALVGNTQFTRASSGALAVHVGYHVDTAADVSVVGAHTTSNGHATVLGFGHDDHLAVSTHRLELLSVADLTWVYNTVQYE